MYSVLVLSCSVLFRCADTAWFSVVRVVCLVAGCLILRLLILMSTTALKSFVKIILLPPRLYSKYNLGSERAVSDLNSCYLLLSLQIGPVSEC